MAFTVLITMILVGTAINSWMIILGTIFGLAIAVYFFVSREEKIEKSIKLNQKVFSTKKLDNAMETVVDRIKFKMR